MPEISFRDFQSRLERNLLSPVYFFHGEEDLLVEEGVDALIGKAVDPATRSFNLDIVYGSKTDAKSALAIASSFPFSPSHFTESSIPPVLIPSTLLISL